MSMDNCRVSYEWHTNRNSELVTKFKNMANNFNIQIALAIQWSECVPSPASDFGSQKITFQLALATDISSLYAMYTYPYLRSSLNEGSFNPMQIGYYDGRTRHVIVSKNWLGVNDTNISQRYNFDQEKGNTG